MEGKYKSTHNRIERFAMISKSFIYSDNSYKWSKFFTMDIYTSMQIYFHCKADNAYPVFKNL